MDVSRIYCGNHVTIHINQTIMLHALNIFDVCQLFLSKTGRKKINVSEDMEKKESLYTLGENIELCSYYGKQ